MKPGDWELSDKLLEIRDQAFRINPDACPRYDQVFRVFELIRPEQVRVVILGQDPYPVPGPDWSSISTNGDACSGGKACGVAFAYSREYTGPVDSSMLNILAELGLKPSQVSRDWLSLSHWINSGVLLLNTRLTVAPYKPMSHAHLGWEIEIKKILADLDGYNKSIIWMNWGAEAQKICPANMMNRIDTSHPCKFSHLSTSNPFTGSRCFARANMILSEMGEEHINWRNV